MRNLRPVNTHICTKDTKKVVCALFTKNIFLLTEINTHTHACEREHTHTHTHTHIQRKKERNKQTKMPEDQGYESVWGRRKESGTLASYTARALLLPISCIICKVKITEIRWKKTTRYLTQHTLPVKYSPETWERKSDVTVHICTFWVFILLIQQTQLWPKIRYLICSNYV